jgi:hypothetical protein
MTEEMSTKLSISDILLKAVKLPLTHALTCIKLAVPLLIPVAAIPFLLFKMAIYGVGATGGAIYDPSLDRFLLVLASCFAIGFGVMMVVGWYQVFILPNTKPKMFRWGSNEGRFLAYSTPIILPTFLLVNTGIMFSNAVVLGLLSVGAMVFLALSPRIFLAFPAAAVNRSIGFGESWRLTKGNTFILIKLLGLPFLAINVLRAFDGMSGIFALLTIPVTLYLYAVGVAVRSLCYKVLVSEA